MSEINKRQDRIIYTRINPISEDLKNKLNLAFKDVVDRFKQKHLS
jgi:hypothetical protein